MYIYVYIYIYIYIYIIYIYITQVSDPTKREFYWMRTLKTLYSNGLQDPCNRIRWDLI